MYADKYVARDAQLKTDDRIKDKKIRSDVL
jgi:hypothetical protein